jgi:hypothetical protein
MWHGFNPDVWRDLETVKELFGLTRMKPAREWPLVFVEEHQALLVVREWPNGTITAYTIPGHPDSHSDR